MERVIFVCDMFNGHSVILYNKNIIPPRKVNRIKMLLFNVGNQFLPLFDHYKSDTLQRLRVYGVLVPFDVCNL